MIQIVEGKGVGSGKSYMVIELLIHQFRQGGSAYASDTFQILWEPLKELVSRRWGLKLQDQQFRSVDTRDISRLHEVTCGGTDDLPVLIVIDEAQDELNARDWAKNAKGELFKWLCQSRHDSNDVVFVTQAAKNIDAQIRRITTYTWSIRNLKTFPIPGVGKIGALASTIVSVFTLGMVKFHGCIFVRAMLDWDGKTQLDRKILVADSALFGCYRSKSMAARRPRLGEPIGRIKLEQERLKRPMTKFILIAAIVGVVCGVVYVSKHGIIPKAPAPIATAAKPGSDRKLWEVTGSVSQVSPAPYDIHREKLLSYGPGWLKTSPGGFFQKGELSAFGMVENIKRNIARVRKPDGRLAYVLAEDWTPPAPVATPRPAVPAQNIVVALDSARAEATSREVHK